MRHLFFLSTIALFGCREAITPPPEPISVDININGNTGDTLTEGFFGFANIVDQPASLNEDLNSDGNLDRFEDVDFDDHLDLAEDTNNNSTLDPGEDIDGDGRLDINEDLDGDGVLDFTNEDTNNNGILDTALPLDINQDGVIDEQDHTTQSIFLMFTSSGETTCDEIVSALEVNQNPTLDGTIFFVQAFQIGIGAGIEVAFTPGAIAATSLNPQNTILVQPVYGVFSQGSPSPDSIADDGGEPSAISIETLGDTLTATFSGDVVNGGELFAYSAQVNDLSECTALSDVLSVLISRGILLQ